MKQFDTKYIAVNREICKACWKCFENCAQQVFGKINILGIHKHIYVKNPDNCVGCKKCVKLCENGAITTPTP